MCVSRCGDLLISYVCGLWLYSLANNKLYTPEFYYGKVEQITFPIRSLQTHETSTDTYTYTRRTPIQLEVYSFPKFDWLGRLYQFPCSMMRSTLQYFPSYSLIVLCVRVCVCVCLSVYIMCILLLRAGVVRLSENVFVLWHLSKNQNWVSIALDDGYITVYMYMELLLVGIRRSTTG